MSDLMDDGAAVDADGNVTANLHEYEGFTEFSNSKEEQTGHYFVFMLDDSVNGERLTIKKNGVEREDKKDLDFERGPMIFRVEQTSDYFEIIVDGSPLITLRFNDCTLE